VQGYLDDQGKSSLFTTATLPIPSTNIVNSDAIMKFARFRSRVLQQIGEVYHDKGQG
jgi:hypothetical protein